MINSHKKVKYKGVFRDNNYAEAVGLGLIKFLRKLFLHTPINRLKITGILREYIYKAVTNINGSSIIKIDIEGYDIFALKGALRTIKKYKPALFIEFIPNLMKACNVNPDEFGGVLFKLYKKCFVIDELSGGAREVKQEDISSFMKAINNNILLVSRDKQESLLQEFIKA